MKSSARTKMMSFRLSDEQYLHFRAICTYRGINNVSELVRDAVDHFLQDQSAAAPVFDTLDMRMARVERQIQTLSTEFESLQRTGARARADHPATETHSERNQ